MSYTEKPDFARLLVDALDRIYKLEQMITKPETYAGDWLTGPTFVNNWANFGGSPAWQTFGYMLDSRGMVHLRGLLINTVGLAAGVTSTIATMPAGFCPLKNEMFIILIGNSSGSRAAARLDVYPSGGISFQASGTVALAAGTNGYISLNGISYSISN